MHDLYGHGEDVFQQRVAAALPPLTRLEAPEHWVPLVP